jgi:TRAP-type mannitol/chloroaromatic compound transport system permease large subunit
VGAVVVLMGVIAMRPMLNAGYDTRLAAGVITAGGTLGILIPPSVMIIVYAAVAGQSVVKLYAAAMFPGFFLAFLYLVYVVGWALLQPKVAPKLPPDQQRAEVSPWVAQLSSAVSPNLFAALWRALLSPGRAFANAAPEARVGTAQLLRGLVSALSPLLLAVATMGLMWWYVVIHSQAVDDTPAPTPAAMSRGAAAPGAGSAPGQAPAAAADSGGLQEPPANAGSGELQEPPSTSGELQTPPSGDTGVQQPPGAAAATPADSGGLQELGEPAAAAAMEPVPDYFYWSFWITCAVMALGLAWYYRRMDAEQFEVLRMLVSSVMPLGLLTLVVLGVILFGITTATESAAVGAAGAFLMAWQARTLTWEKTKQAVFLTAKTTAMVCWLFVGSALFSAVFAILGGQAIIEHWVLKLQLSPLQFLLLSQAIIFVLGWPLEWTEIIVIFVPIFLPLLAHFQIDPLLFGTMVFVNLQAAFLSPPVAMSAFYLKGVSPPHVTINQIFAGMMPYMAIVVLCMVIMYVWPSLTLWLPQVLYK